MASNLNPLVARVVGVLMVGVACVWLLWTWHFLESGVSTYGHIVEKRAMPNVEVFPVFAFETEAGERYQDFATGGSFVALYDIGERVPVIYDPNDPTNAKINTFWETWLGPIFVLVGGFVFLITSFRQK